MRFIFLAISFFYTVKGITQNVTGTWIATYHRDQLQDKRLFYYRLYLQEKNDSLVGICEALDAQADINNLPIEDLKVVAAYKVYAAGLDSKKDTTTFELIVGEPVILNGNPVASAHTPPSFFRLVCHIQPATIVQTQQPSILYSVLPGKDGAVAQLQVKKLANDLPDLSQYEMEPFVKWRLNFASFEKPLQVFTRKIKSKGSLTKENDKEARILTYKEREEKVQSELLIESTVVHISIYDNGIVDNDTISLYLNDKVVLEKKRVSGTAIQLELNLDVQKENKLTLFAHNLGDIAPNTAYMIVECGSQQYKLHLSASMERNATVLLKMKQ